MQFLKQSTASQSVLIGPFVDSTDGDAEEIALTIANTDIRLSKNGGNLAAKTSGGGTHDEDGWYAITLDATDTNTVGRLQLHCHVAGALMVAAEYTVLEEAIYDALFAASAAGFDANQRVDVGSVLGTAQTAGDLAALINTVDDLLDTEVAAITTAVITNAVGADIAADIATAQADLDTLTGTDGATLATAQALYAPAKAGDAMTLSANAVDAAALAADAGTEIAAAVNGATLADAYAANGVAPTLQQAVMAIHQMLMDFGINATSVDVRKVDGTAAFSVTLDDATSPTDASR